MRNLVKRVHNTYYTSNNGAVGSYLSDISKYKILSDNEIKNEIVKAKKGDKKAIERIVNCNQRFVFSLAKRFSNGNNELLMDLINEANIGLINSIKYFDLKKNNYFLTYSVFWMQRQIYLYLTFTNPMVKITNKSKTTKVSEIKNQFYLKNGRTPTSEEIINELKNKHDIDILNKSDLYQCSTTSIDEHFSDEKNDEFSPNLINNFEVNSNMINDYEIQSENEYSKSLISNSIGILNDREKKVVEMLYGIGDYRGYEIQEVACKLGITKEAVRLINKRALEKLKEEITVKQFVI